MTFVGDSVVEIAVVSLKDELVVVMGSLDVVVAIG